MENSAKAIAKNLRVSPRKLNLLASKIRGMNVAQALNFLRFSQKRSALDVRKNLESAIANAENNYNMDTDRLYVKEAYVGPGVRMRRFLPHAKGRAGTMHKPFSHLSIIVSEKEEKKD